MSARILMTGIPSHYSRLINYASGKNIYYAERLGRPANKHDFMRELGYSHEFREAVAAFLNKRK